MKHLFAIITAAIIALLSVAQAQAAQSAEYFCFDNSNNGASVGYRIFSTDKADDYGILWSHHHERAEESIRCIRLLDIHKVRLGHQYRPIIHAHGALRNKDRNCGGKPPNDRWYPDDKGKVYLFRATGTTIFKVNCQVTRIALPARFKSPFDKKD